MAAGRATDHDSFAWLSWRHTKNHVNIIPRKRRFLESGGFVGLLVVVVVVVVVDLTLKRP